MDPTPLAPALVLLERGRDGEALALLQTPREGAGEAERLALLGFLRLRRGDPGGYRALALEAPLGRVQAGGVALGSGAGLLGTLLAPLLGPKGAVALTFLFLLALGLAYPALSPGRLERLKEGTW